MKQNTSAKEKLSGQTKADQLLVGGSVTATEPVIYPFQPQPNTRLSAGGKPEAAEPKNFFDKQS